MATYTRSDAQYERNARPETAHRSVHATGLVMILAVLLTLSMVAGAYAQVCIYASSASATSEQDSFRAEYATGAPSGNGVCTDASPGHAWAPTTWDTVETLTLGFAQNLSFDSLTVFGDQGMTWERIQAYDHLTDSWITIGADVLDCVADIDVAATVWSDTIRLTKHPYGWSATDAVMICGEEELPTTCALGESIAPGCDPLVGSCAVTCVEYLRPGDDVCVFASSAQTTSEQEDFRAAYATGIPSGNGVCTEASPGHAWAPSHWDSIESLTLTFGVSLDATSLTVFGDQGMNWIRTEAFDRSIGVWRSTSGYTEECVAESSLDVFTNSVRLTKGTQGWSATDAVMLCGTVTDRDGCDDPFSDDPACVREREPCEDCASIVDLTIDFCEWEGCAPAAASVSVDDGFTSCSADLEAHGVRGTYYLNGTHRYTDADWDMWTQMALAGHEIGAHTRSHSCIVLDEAEWRMDLEGNIADLTANLPITGVRTLAYPCGISDAQMRSVAAEYFDSARGYHDNRLERPSPRDRYNLMSINTPFYHEPDLAPPDLFVMADEALESGSWAHFTFHNECSEPGIIPYAVSRGMWFMPVSDVVDYIEVRDAARIIETDDGFQLIGDTLWVRATFPGIMRVFVNDVQVPFERIDATVYFEVPENGRFSFELSSEPERVCIGECLPDVIVDRCTVANEPVCAGLIETVATDGLCTQYACVSGARRTEFTSCIDDDHLDISIDRWYGPRLEICQSGTCLKELTGRIPTREVCTPLPADPLVYVVPYIGDIDGSVGAPWYPAYESLIGWHHSRRIPLGFSFFPATLVDHPSLRAIFALSASDDLIVPIQKGNTGRGDELRMEELTVSEQRSIISAGTDAYRTFMARMGLVPEELRVYNAPAGRFTAQIRDVLISLGFMSDLDVYYPPELTPVPSVPGFDVTQYGVSFTRTGGAGPALPWKTTDEIIDEILTYDRSDVEVLTIRDAPVVLLFVHQQDFSLGDEPRIDPHKRTIYEETYRRILEDERIGVITPLEFYELRHGDMR